MYGCIEAKGVDKDFIAIKEGDYNLCIMKPNDKICKVDIYYENKKGSQPVYSCDIKVDGNIEDVNIEISGEKYKIPINELKEIKYDKSNANITMKINDHEISEFKRIRAKESISSTISEIFKSKNDVRYLKVDLVEDWKIELKKSSVVFKESFEKNLKQLFGELLWYGKVLYTNGLVWKYLEVKVCENKEKGIKSIIDLRKVLYDNCIKSKKEEWYKLLSGKDWHIEITCETIADFTEDFKTYLDEKSDDYEGLIEKLNNDHNQKDENKLQYTKWTKLIKGLANIIGTLNL